MDLSCVVKIRRFIITTVQIRQFHFELFIRISQKQDEYIFDDTCNWFDLINNILFFDDGHMHYHEVQMLIEITIKHVLRFIQEISWYLSFKIIILLRSWNS